MIAYLIIGHFGNPEGDKVIAAYRSRTAAYRFFKLLNKYDETNEIYTGRFEATAPGFAEYVKRRMAWYKSHPSEVVRAVGETPFSYGVRRVRLR